MRKTLFILFIFVSIGTGAFAQHIQASLRYDAASEDAIIKIRNGGTTSYVGNLTSFDITIGLSHQDIALRRMYFLFSSAPAAYTAYTNFTYPFYHFHWTGSFAIDLAPGEELDLVSAKLKNTWIMPIAPSVGLAALGPEYQHKWSVKINNIEEGDPLNRFYDPGTPGSSLMNHQLGSNLRIPVQYALPIKLADFTASAEGSSVTLNWATTEERNSGIFEVQQSIDSKSWKKIGAVAASGESSTTQHYSFNHHPETSGNNYYRLKMIDTDLTYAFSKIEVVDTQNSSAAIYPNPVENQFSLQDIDAKTVASVKIYNAIGKLVRHSETVKGPVLVEHLLPGNYIAVIQKRDGSLVNYKFVKR